MRITKAPFSSYMNSIFLPTLVLFFPKQALSYSPHKQHHTSSVFCFSPHKQHHTFYLFFPHKQHRTSSVILFPIQTAPHKFCLFSCTSSTTQVNSPVPNKFYSSQHKFCLTTHRARNRMGMLLSCCGLCGDRPSSEYNNMGGSDDAVSQHSIILCF